MLYVIQIYSIKTNELLMEEDIREFNISNAEQYAKNLVEDYFDFREVYYQVS